MNRIFYQALFNVYGCDYKLLNTVNPLKQKFDQLIKAESLDARDYFHQFFNKEKKNLPEGVTGFYLSEGGHLSVHTWPEQKMAAIDIILPSSPQVRNLSSCLKEVLPAELFLDLSQEIVPEEKKVGRQVVAYLKDIKYPGYLETESSLVKTLKEISEQAHFNVVGELARSCLWCPTIDAALVLSESHFSFHYDQKKRNARVDIFTCGREGDPQKGLDLLLEKISPRSSSTRYYKKR